MISRRETGSYGASGGGRRRRRGHLLRTVGVSALVAVVAVTTIGSGGAALAATREPSDTKAPKPKTAVRSIAWRTVSGRAAVHGTGLRQATATAPDWPSAGSATMAVGAAPTKVGSTVVSLVAPDKASGARPSGTAPAPHRRFTVRTLDQAGARKLGALGLAFTVDPADDAAAGPLGIRADVSGVTQAFGGDLAAHLKLQRLPGCALTTPAVPACRRATDVPSHVDLRIGTLVADLPAGTAAKTTPNAPTATTTTAAVSPLTATTTAATDVFVLAADTGGEAGDYSATALGVSSTWQVGQQSGDFSWTYPMPEVPAVAGDSPNLQLVYSSQSVDGLTGSRNTQPTWVGLGWNLAVPYLERAYTSCTEKGSALQDKCWGGDVLTLSLAGHSAPLVKDPEAGADVWRLRDDPGWTVRRLHLAADDPGNGDNDGEYWQVTTADGTRYVFGRGHQPGTGTATKSVQTEPVYGLESGDPCHTGTESTSWCQQGYKWNLDEIIDPHGNLQTYVYEQETNSYQRGNAAPTRYVRDAHLVDVLYGQRSGAEDVQAPVRLHLTSLRRCIDAADGSGDCPPISQANSAAYPDVPTYLVCADDAASCTQHSPSYFSGVLLRSVTAQRRDGASWANVDRVDLTYSFPEPTDGTTASLWLERVTRTGLAGNGSAALPDLTFAGKELPNRIDADPALGVPQMRKLRITAVTDELGRQVEVTYGQPDPCGPADFPQGHADTNSQDCFPAIRANGMSEPGFGWYYKYLSTRTTESDLTGGGVPQVTEYDYRGAPAWHRDDAPLVPDREQSWGDWRGYGEVDVRTMSDPAYRDEATSRVLSVTRSRFYRGMDGDQLAAGGTKSVSVTDSRGGSVPDLPWLNGRLREEQQLDVSATGAIGAELGGKITDYDSVRTTPYTPGKEDPQHDAHNAVAVKVVTREAVIAENSGARSTRTKTTTTTYDEYGQQLTTTNTATGTGAASDVRCSRSSYARDTTTVDAGMLSYPYRVRTYSGPCTAPTALLSAKDTFFDGSATLGATVVRGDPTRTVSAVTATGPDGVGETVTQSATYDAYGRTLTSTDGRGLTTRTTFTPDTGRPTSTTVTDPLGHATSTTVDPDRGLPVRVEDANGQVTTTAYDPLGRRTSVRTPEQAADDPPALTFAYALDPDRKRPAEVTTRQLQSGTTYLTTYTFTDGLGRPRQTQTVSPASTASAPKTVLVDTRYDDRGQVAAKTVPTVAAGTAGSALVAVDPSASDETRTSYDTAGRTVKAELFSAGKAKWATTTAYYGDHSRTTPPTGGTALTTWMDVWGRTVRKDEGTGADLVSRTYTYDGADRIVTITDPAGHVSRTGYDLLGRVVSSTDPDAGTSTSDYDADGNLTATTDAKGTTVTVDYDAGNRPTTIWQGASGSGTTLHAYAYDSTTISNGIGRVASQATYNDGKTYTRKVTGYDPRGRTLGRTWQFPAGLGLRLGPSEFTTSYTYDTAGHQTSITYQDAVLGAAAETVTTGYDDLGYPTTLTTTPSGTGGDTTTLVSGTGYAADGKLVSRDYANPLYPITRQYSYETGTQRLSNVTTLVGNPFTSDKAVEQDDDYVWDPSGNLTRVTDNTSTDLIHSKPVNTCYTYDGLARLTHAWTTRTPDCTDTSSTLTAAGTAGMNESWTYSDDGNITSARSQLVTTHYTYGDSAHPHAVTKQGLNTYEYDANGAMSSRLQGLLPGTLTWNAEHRLTKVTKGASCTGYVYGADGTRLARLNPDATATLYIDGQEIWIVAGIIKGIRFYSHAGTVVAQRLVLGTLVWQLNDVQGSAQLHVYAGTGIVKRTYYDPYGRIRPGIGAYDPVTDHGFLGSVKDPGPGLNALGARLYDAELARFISVDPANNQASAQSANPYAYGDNNPTLYADPTGLWSVSGAWNSVTSAASSAGNWVGEHKNQIASVAVGTVVAVGVAVAIGASCATVVGCVVVGAAVGAAAGAAGGAASYATDIATGEEKNPSWKGFFTSVGVGAATGAVVGGVLGGLGQALKPVVRSLGTRLAASESTLLRGAGNGIRRLAGGGKPGGGGGTGEPAAPSAGKPTAPKAPVESPGASTAGGGSTSGTATAGASNGSTAADTAGSIRAVNPLGGVTNCVNCAVATDSTLSGAPAQALLSGPKPISALEKIYGRIFKSVSGQSDIESILSNAGPGARGIVFGSRGTQVGHVWNAVNQNGRIRFLDGQSGGVASFDGYSSFSFLRTN